MFSSAVADWLVRVLAWMRSLSSTEQKVCGRPEKVQITLVSRKKVENDLSRQGATLIVDILMHRMIR
ncbi:hypothetical protein [Streptomyces sp. NPDC006267]|uniref:hypothetical protein n=1 Tax=unclassified Streptomyces TaxID=2593676 RepID=UPI0033A8C59E